MRTTIPADLVQCRTLAAVLRIKTDSGQCALCGARHKPHSRRKFFDLYEATQSPIAQEALDRIGALYGIESEIRGKPLDERRAVRQL